uniref:Serine/threonine-protein phosphatase n=1 Tax=Caenorhabditis japonica TaxID=281687 RepID=A0A8R1HSN6_CAEJA
MKYTKEEYDNIIYEVSQIFSSEKALIDVDPPCVVVGDLHGQFNDLMNMFVLLGRPPEVVYVFTGDYVDRGAMSLECIMLLFAYKICYPENIYLLRGNHEIARVNKKYGFYDECIGAIPKYGEEVWALFQRCFNNLPIAALIATKILCMHGGLSPSLVTLDDLRYHKKPIRNPFRGIVNDMLWADPDPSVFEWKTSTRGSGFVFGTNVIDDVCTRLGIELIIRAHQMCFDGYWTVAGRKLITIFSAPVYCNLYKNAASVLRVDEKLCVQVIAFVPETRDIERLIKTKNRVWDHTLDNLD